MKKNQLKKLAKLTERIEELQSRLAIVEVEPMVLTIGKLDLQLKPAFRQQIKNAIVQELQDEIDAAKAELAAAGIEDA